MEFIKTYRGTLEITFAVREHEVSSYGRDGHKVQYLGRLDLEQRSIAGRWVIRYRGFLGWILPPQDWGSFELYKKA
ncbi:MAG TPA: hypothetical protein VFF52_25030 [Isosphaeraceae bacterium]|nr:hypothetical protein [Isosphaeraceae bacterium]